MIKAISGCVITEEKGHNIRYQKKCDSCGNVSPETINTSINSNSRFNDSFKCPKCGKQVKIVIQG